jgi:hypothetical protein
MPVEEVTVEPQLVPRLMVGTLSSLFFFVPTIINLKRNELDPRDNFLLKDLFYGWFTLLMVWLGLPLKIRRQADHGSGTPLKEVLRGVLFFILSL